MSGYQTVAAADATEYGVPTQLFSDLIQGESSFNPNATNQSTGAQGIAQVLPSTAANPGFGVQPLANPYDPTSALQFAAQYLAAMFQKFGNWVQAVEAYQQGPGVAQSNPGYLPQASSAVVTDLQQLGGGPTITGNNNAASGGTPSTTNPGGVTTATNPQSSPDTSASSQSSGCTSWATTPTACITATLTEIAFVLLALIVLGVGLFMLRDKTGASK